MEHKKESLGGRFLRGGIQGAPAWTVILLVVAAGLGIIKTLTGFPEFLSQLQIFGIGISLGLVAAIYAWRNEVKTDKILKTSKDLTPSQAVWFENTNSLNHVKIFTDRETKTRQLINYGGNWATGTINGQVYFLGAFSTAEQLNQAVEAHYLRLRK